jgi:hypothetical protein
VRHRVKLRPLHGQQQLKQQPHHVHFLLPRLLPQRHLLRQLQYRLRLLRHSRPVPHLLSRIHRHPERLHRWQSRGWHPQLHALHFSLRQLRGQLPDLHFLRERVQHEGRQLSQQLQLRRLGDLQRQPRAVPDQLPGLPQPDGGLGGRRGQQHHHQFHRRWLGHRRHVRDLLRLSRQQRRDQQPEQYEQPAELGQHQQHAGLDYQSVNRRRQQHRRQRPLPNHHHHPRCGHPCGCPTYLSFYLVIVAAIVIIYCVHKRRKEQAEGMNEWNNSTGAGGDTGRNIELTTNQTKRAYL